MKKLTLQQQLNLANAQLDNYEEQKDQLLDLFQKVRENFDESEYQQGKKDGIRIALTFFTGNDWVRFNRGGKVARE